MMGCGPGAVNSYLRMAAMQMCMTLLCTQGCPESFPLMSRIPKSKAPSARRHRAVGQGAPDCRGRGDEVGGVFREVLGSVLESIKKKK